MGVERPAEPPPGAQCGLCPAAQEGGIPGKKCTPAKPVPTGVKAVVVAELPSGTDEVHGLLSTDYSGLEFWRMARAAGLRREEIHVTAAMLCRPKRLKKEAPVAAYACAGRLAKELQALPGEVPIVPLGTIAESILTGHGNIAKGRGFVWRVPGTPRKSAPKLPEAGAKTLRAKLLAHAQYAVRSALAGRVVLPTLDPRQVLRMQPTWAPLIGVDLKRVARWLTREPGLLLEDEGKQIVCATAAELALELADWRPGGGFHDVVVVDVETAGKEALTTPLQMVGFCDVESGLVVQAYPWRPDMARIVTDFLRTRSVVWHNGESFDAIVLERHGVALPPVRHDTLVMHHAMASHLRQSLDHCVSNYCDSGPWKLKHRGQTKDDKGGFGVRGEDLPEYNGSDVRLNALLFRRMAAEISDRDRPVYAIDMRLAEIARRMRVHGLAVDEGRRQALIKACRGREEALLSELRRAVGDVQFEPSKAAHIRGVLYRNQKPRAWTPTGESSTDKGALEAMARDGGPEGHVAKLVMGWRAARDARTEYLEALQPANGRVHCSWRMPSTDCLPAGELVLTNRGYLPVELVAGGSRVFVIGASGKPCRIIARGPKGVDPIVVVRLANGLQLRCTPHHPLSTTTGWRRADELRNGDQVHCLGGPEEWRPIRGWNGYHISSWGRVVGPSGQLRLSHKGQWGHLKVTIHVRNRKRDYSVHRLVAEAFLGPCPPGYEVRHLDGIAWNNHVENLRWGTSEENKADAIRHGTMGRKTSATAAHLTENDAHEIRRQLEAIPKGHHGRAGILRPLAVKYGISYEVLRRFRVNKTWIPGSHGGAKAVFITSPVTEITRESPEPVWGLTVETDASHVTSGILSHNTGRPAARDPNLLNMPRIPHCKECGIAMVEGTLHKVGCSHGSEPHEPAGQIRDIYIAAPGHAFVYFDLSQAEMRFAAHIYGDGPMMKACEADVHAGNAAVIFPEHADVIAADPKGRGKPYRDIAKNIGFAIAYQAGADTVHAYLLAHGFPDVKREDVERMLTRLHVAYKHFYAWVDFQYRFVKKYGFLRTVWSGRKRTFGRFRVSKPEVSNYHMQAGVADVMNAAILALDDVLPKAARLVFYQYDSLIYETPLPLVEEVKARIVEHWARPLTVPAWPASGMNAISFVQPIDVHVGERLSEL